MDDMIIQVSITRLDLVERTTRFDFRDRQESKTLELVIPQGTKPGEYFVKVEAFTKHRDDVVFATLTVKEPAIEFSTASFTGLESITGQSVRYDDTSLFSSSLFLLTIMGAISIIIVYIIYRL